DAVGAVVGEEMAGLMQRCRRKCPTHAQAKSGILLDFGGGTGMLLRTDHACYGEEGVSGPEAKARTRAERGIALGGQGPVNTRHDCVIVGGGNLGLWTAYHLARRGRLRVAVCEGTWAGNGATSRSAGMIRQQGGTVTAVRLGMRSRALYLQLG